MEHKLALNPARVLLYIEANDECQQKDMLEPLGISRAVLSQCCQLLINKGLIFQAGSYIAKKHCLETKGKILLKSIKS
jgi:DNA-binding MarR family transcriptional regulator